MREVVLFSGINNLIKSVESSQLTKQNYIICHPTFYSKLMQYMLFGAKRKWRELKRQGKTNLSRSEWLKENGLVYG